MCLQASSMTGVSLCASFMGWRLQWESMEGFDKACAMD